MDEPPPDRSVAAILERILRFHELRSSGAVVWDPEGKGWLVSGYAEVLQVLRDRRLSANPATLGQHPGDLPPGAPQRLSPHQVLFTDPPDHGRLRRHLQPLFGPRATEQRRPAITTIAEELLDTAEPAGRLEVMTQLALPLTRRVLLDLLDVPTEQRDAVWEWCSAISPLMISVHGVNATREQSDRAQQSLQRLMEVAPPLLTRLSSDLTVEELMANAAIFFHAGQKNSAQLIGTGLLALQRHPAVWSRLQREPELIPAAVEEILRYDGPVHAAARWAREDIELGGQRIRRGQQVLLLLTAANRDAAQFPAPAAFDITRPAGQHVAFGAGIHYCLGAPAARLQTEVALTALLRRWPHLEVEPGAAAFTQTFDLSGLQSLWVRF